MEVEAKAEAKSNYEKVPNIMINNIRFKIIAGEIKQNSRILHDFTLAEFYTIFARKNAGVGLWSKTVKCLKHCKYNKWGTTWVRCWRLVNGGRSAIVHA